MIKKIKLSEETTIVIETVQPAKDLSKEVNIYLESDDDTQDLMLLREKLARDRNHQDFCSDPSQIEVLAWDDPDDENYTKRILINKQTALAK